MLRATQRIGFTSRAAMAPRVNAARTMSTNQPTIVYTETDEAPNLATYSLLPVIKKMVSLAGIDVVKSDISLSGRIICQFPENMKTDQVVPDELTRLGKCLYFLRVLYFPILVCVDGTMCLHVCAYVLSRFLLHT